MILWTVDPYGLSGSSVHETPPGKNTVVGCYVCLQGIFSTQELNPHLLWLLHCRWVLYHWATYEAPLSISVSLSQAAVHGCSLCSLYESAWLRVQRAKIQLHSAGRIVHPGTASTQRGCLFLSYTRHSLVAGLALELTAINSTVVVCLHVCLPPKKNFFFFATWLSYVSTKSLPLGHQPGLFFPLAMLALHCCAWTFSSWDERELLSSWCASFSLR